MYTALKTAKQAKERLETFALEQVRRQRLASYLKSDRRPWRTGFMEYRNQYLAKVVNDDTILETFRNDRPLPAGYAFRLDARLVEIPWFLARAGQREGSLLDAGSSLNYDFVLTSPALSNKRITLETLAPEAVSYWRLGVSYVFGDLRDLDFRDNCFDAISCISTIEHVGMDNTRYAGADERAKKGDPKTFALAIRELRRVLKPDGSLYLTFPFGEYEDHGWFQQFDSHLVDELVEIFNPGLFYESIFRYHPEGWKISDRASCMHCQYFDPHISKYFDPQSTIEYPLDYPAGERAVACLELRKK